MAGLYGCFKGRNSDRAAMASGSPDVSTNQEPAEVQEECSGKKKSKFQTFKRFFARKKRKEPSPAGADAGLKASQSTDNVSKASENNTLTRSEKDKGSGSKISLGSKALSHDSVFVSDSSEANEALGASQDSIHGKVKSLQLQLKQAIRLGSPPSLMCVKKAEDVGTMSEDDGLPCSPPEYTTHHTVMNQAQMNSSISLEGIDSDDEQLSHAASSRAMSPLVVPGDFSLPASPFGCLDNSAAKHKLGLRHKACNRRKPTSRPDGKAEGDSAVEEMLTTSMEEVEMDGMEEPQQQLRIEDVGDHQLKPKVDKEEEEEDEVEETEPPQHSRRSLLRDKEEEEEEVVEEEEEEGEDEPETEQDVSHGPDTSCPPEPRLSEEEASESQPLPSSEPSSRASSLDSPRATPEPPTGLREYLLDPPGFVYGADKKFDSDSASESEEDGVQGTMEEEEETSLLQEVLSSLKTPLGSLDVKTEDVFLEMKQEAEGKLKEEAEIEEGEEAKEEEAEEHQPISYQFTPSCSVLSSQATEEEEEVVTRSYQEEEEEEEEEKEEEGEQVVAVEEVKGEEAEEEKEEGEEEEEEDVAVEQLTQHGHEEEEGQKEDAEEVQPVEESSVLTRQTISQAAEEEVEEESEEGEEEAIELEKEPEVEEEAREKTEEEEDDDDGVVAVEVIEGRGVEEAEEAMEEEKSEAEEMLPEVQEEAEVQIETSMHEADEGVVLTDDGVCGEHKGHDDEIPADLSDQVVALVQEEQEKSSQTSGDEIEDAEEGEEDGEEISPEEKKQEEEEEEEEEEKVEANQMDADETEQDLKQESVEATPHADVDPSEATEQASVSSRPPSLSLPESPSETRSPASGPTTPSKTSVIHINLISPSSEKAISFFQTSPTKAEPSESVTQSPPADPTEETEMDLAGGGEEEEKEKAQVQDATAPVSAEEEADRLPSSSDQSKARFNVSPAWQRPQSLTPPSSPPASSPSTVAAPSSEEVEEAAASKKVELVLSPSKMRSVGSVAAKPQNSATPAPVKPQTSAPASTEESSPAMEGSNPFGVRLRKTSGILRLGSEEENTEPPVESPTPPTSTKVDPPQPVSVKPSVYQPISNKPVVPKKPEVHGEGGGKLKRVSDPATGRGASAGTNSPSWISMAKQKQKIYKENSLEEITVKKEEQERKSSLPMYVGLAASREHSNKTAESSSKVSKSEISKPSASVEKEAKRALSPPTPVPPQPSKSQSLPCPVAPKPQVPAVGAKHPPQPNAPQRSVQPPTPVPVPQKPPTCTSPLSLSKPATPPKTPLVTSPPFSSRPVPEKPGAKAAGLSGQTPSPQRGLPSPSLPQDEPPWMALAKKKAKAWSEMPQIVQ